MQTNSDFSVLNNQTSEMFSTGTHFSKVTKFKATQFCGEQRVASGQEMQ